MPEQQTKIYASQFDIPFLFFDHAKNEHIATVNFQEHTFYIIIHNACQLITWY